MIDVKSNMAAFCNIIKGSNNYCKNFCIDIYLEKQKLNRTFI